MDFTFKIYLPTVKKYVRFKQINNKEYGVLVRYIQNSDDEYILKCLENIITEHIVDREVTKINKIDMFCVLLNLRILCVSDTLDITYNTEHEGEKISQKIHINLYDILDKVTNYEIDYDYVHKIGEECSLTLRPPAQMKYETSTDILTSVIDDLYIGNKKYKLSSFTEEQINIIIDSLPSNVIKTLVEYIKNIDTEYKVSIFSVNTAMQAAGVKDSTANDYELRMFDSSFYDFIKLCYSDNLNNIYYTRYIMTKHLGYTQSSLDDMTPQDLNTYITMYKKELEDERKAAEKQSKPNSSMTLPNPGLGEQL